MRYSSVESGVLLLLAYVSVTEHVCTCMFVCVSVRVKEVKDGSRRLQSGSAEECVYHVSYMSVSTGIPSGAVPLQGAGQ